MQMFSNELALHPPSYQRKLYWAPVSIGGAFRSILFTKYNSESPPKPHGALRTKEGRVKLRPRLEAAPGLLLYIHLSHVGPKLSLRRNRITEPGGQPHGA